MSIDGGRIVPYLYIGILYSNEYKWIITEPNATEGLKTTVLSEKVIQKVMYADSI